MHFAYATLYYGIEINIRVNSWINKEVSRYNHFIN